MPRFGADGLLTAAQMSDVAEYVMSMTGRSTDAAAVTRGEVVYAENCASCHGDRGEGNRDVGAPRLSDQVWLHGDGKAQILAMLHNPRLGVMPPWQGRLDPAVINMLTVYVHALGGGE
jgi:cytochrome c oxidase cbb3-type subunit 3